MKNVIKKKVIIILAAVVAVLAVAIPISVKNIRSYVAYADGFGSDTIEEAVERLIENNSYKEQIMGIYPQKALEDRYGKKWWENSKYLETEHEVMMPSIKYGKSREYRYLEIVSKMKVRADYFKESFDFTNICNAGLEVEEGYGLTVNYQKRIRYDYDVTLEGEENEEYSPVGKWSEWDGYYNRACVVYKVAGKWYCRYWEE